MTNQSHFLLGLGIKEYQNSALVKNKSNLQSAAHEALIDYKLLVNMGMKFIVLIQQKGVLNYSLSGLKFLNLSTTINN